MSLPDVTSRLLATRFVALRQHRGLSQTTLAEMAGLSRSAVINAESGQSQMTVRTLLLLAKALGIEGYKMLRDNPRGSCGHCGSPACILRDWYSAPSSELFTAALREDAERLRAPGLRARLSG